MSEVTRRKHSNTAMLHEFQSYLRKFHRIVSLAASFRQSPCTSTTWLPQGALKARVPRLEMAPPRAFNLMMINRWINQMGTLCWTQTHRIHVWYIC